MSISTAKKRIERFLTAAVKTKKKSVKKPAAKKPAKAAKKTPAALSTLETKLAKIAKKHGVKISLKRNKTKLSVIAVSGLRNVTFEKLESLFKEIPNTSHVPQKITKDVALFRVFGESKPK